MLIVTLVLVNVIEAKSDDFEDDVDYDFLPIRFIFAHATFGLGDS